MTVVDGAGLFLIFLRVSSVDMRDRSGVAAAWPQLVLMLTRPTDQQ
jgi:hypothetical protein